MSITYNGKEIVRLSRTLEINPTTGRKYIYLGFPNRDELPSNTQYVPDVDHPEIKDIEGIIIHESDNTLARIPIRGKIKASDVDAVGGDFGEILKESSHTPQQLRQLYRDLDRVMKSFEPRRKRK